MIPEKMLPVYVRTRAIGHAQNAALESIQFVEPGPARPELFWLTFNFELRKYIERWLKENGNV